MEILKCVFYVLEVLLSIWILYRSGRIVLNKGNEDDRIELVNNRLMIIVVYMSALLSGVWRINFISWILFYCSMVYAFVFVIYVIKRTKKEKVMLATVLLLTGIVVPFI